jgi:hypothetical protein
MSYETDITSGVAGDPVPGGGGSIANFEAGLGGPWSAGYSRIDIGGDLPGYQADAHVNFRLPGDWLFQLGASMGEVAQFPGGPRRNDFVGTTYSLIKSFRISSQWTFQASYTNVPNRLYAGELERPIASRLGYHLLTVSYSPRKEIGNTGCSLDAGLLRLTDIRPAGFNYLFAGVTYRFQVPRLL